MEPMYNYSYLSQTRVQLYVSFSLEFKKAGNTRPVVIIVTIVENLRISNSVLQFDQNKQAFELQSKIRINKLKINIAFFFKKFYWFVQVLLEIVAK